MGIRRESIINIRYNCPKPFNAKNDKNYNEGIDMASTLNRKAGGSHPLANTTLDYAEILIALLILILLISSIEEIIDFFNLVKAILCPNSFSYGP